jgi:hypothetical protein
MAMTDLCPSCREPLDYPSGDGCAAMTRHQPHQCASPEAIVKAALERAARVADKKIFHFTGHWAGVLLECEFKKILDLASDPAEVAAIIKNAAGEDRG